MTGLVKKKKKKRKKITKSSALREFEPGSFWFVLGLSKHFDAFLIQLSVFLWLLEKRERIQGYEWFWIERAFKFKLLCPRLAQHELRQRFIVVPIGSFWKRFTCRQGWISGKHHAPCDWLLSLPKFQSDCKVHLWTHVKGPFVSHMQATYGPALNASVAQEMPHNSRAICDDIINRVFSQSLGISHSWSFFARALLRHIVPSGTICKAPHVWLVHWDPTDFVKKHHKSLVYTLPH